MCDMSNNPFIPKFISALNSQIISNLPSVLKFDRLLHRLDNFGLCVRIYVGENPQLDANDPIMFEK